MESRNGESVVMYLIQFGNYRMYDNARKTLLEAKQNGIEAVMRYDGEVFRVVSKVQFEDRSIALLICEALQKVRGRLSFAFVRKTDSF